MLVFIAGGLSTNYSPDLKVNVLESYFAYKNKELKITKDYVKKFFLDSGAFSAWTKKIPINIKYYCEYIKRNIAKLDYYACLDEIGSAEKTQTNLEIMEKEGLHPLPVYHYGEPFDVFKRLVEKYDHMAIGGLVPISTKNLIPFLDEIFGYICDKEGKTNKKLHGFGMTTVSLMEKYPWFSVDSISPIITAAMGGIYNEDGKVISLAMKGYIPHSVEIALGEENKGGFVLPEGSFKENTLTKGFSFMQLKYKYKTRIVVNIRYMMKLEERLTLNPPIFKQYQTKLL